MPEGIFRPKVYGDAFFIGSAPNGTALRWDASADELVLAGGTDIVCAATTGTKIGTEASQKLGFFGATPSAQQAAVADAAGGATVDSEARTALNALLARLRTLGLIAT